MTIDRFCKKVLRCEQEFVLSFLPELPVVSFLSNAGATAARS
jgi:hypothetical protein